MLLSSVISPKMAFLVIVWLQYITEQIIAGCHKKNNNECMAAMKIK